MKKVQLFAAALVAVALTACNEPAGEADAATDAETTEVEAQEADAGAEGDADAGAEGDADAGAEGDADAGAEGEADAGAEGEADAIEGDI